MNQLLVAVNNCLAGNQSPSIWRGRGRPDIDNQPINNYAYDAIGNLIKDSLEKITNIKWSVYGKVLEVTRTATATAPVTNIKYTYDAQGNRISKVYDNDGTKTYTWYVRDAQGNVISTYTSDGNNANLQNLTLNQVERYMYGSSRLGMYAEPSNVDHSNAGPASFPIPAGTTLLSSRGLKQYELVNHLGNVLATITDKKIAVPSDTNSSFTGYYEPEIVGAFGYYPFGAMSRIYVNYDQPAYRFGFNGKELDHEMKGNSASYDYGMRIYDPRIGRFLSVDPLTKSFAMLTPYQFASNSPIANLDLDGGEAKYFNIEIIETYNGNGKFVKEESRHVEDKSKEAGWFVNGSIYKPSGSLGSGTLFTYTRITQTLKNDGSEEIIIQDNGALYIPSTADKGRGGFYFVSSSGGYSHSSGSLDGEDAIPINLDLLVNAVGGFPKGNLDTEMSPFAYTGDEVNKLAKLPEILKSDKEFAAKFEKVLSGIKALLNTEKSGEKVGKAVDEYLSSKALDENDKMKSGGAEFLQCESCKAYRKVGERNVMPATKKDTANKGITPKNTKPIPLESFHSN